MMTPWVSLLALALDQQVRPEVLEAGQKADALVADLEEQKALDLMDKLATRGDLTTVDMALIQMWRGIAFHGLNQEKDGNAAFAVSRACDDALGPPASVSPKVAAVFKKTKPGQCPVTAKAVPHAAAADEGMEFTLKMDGDKATAPAPGQEKLFEGPSDAPKKAPAATSTAAGASAGGGKVKRLSGAGLLAAGAAVGVLAALAVVGGVGSLLASFPVVTHGNAQAKVTAYRRDLMMGFLMRVGGVTALPVAAVMALVGVTVLAGGAGLLTWGFLG